MKRFSLLTLVAFFFAAGCTDSTAPANSRAVQSNTGPFSFGDPPPPPVDAVIVVDVFSPGRAIFTGVYFTNASGVGLTETVDGTAWLRFDNKQPDLSGLEGSASANARFMVKNTDTPTGKGTFVIREGATFMTYTIVAVRDFHRFPSCGAPEPGFQSSPCATINFTLQLAGEVCHPDTFLGCHRAQAAAFNKSSCLINGDGGLMFDFESCPVGSVD